jgi:hypothetical protein
MNRKLRNTILAFSVTGMVLALGLMAARPMVDAGAGEVRALAGAQAPAAPARTAPLMPLADTPGQDVSALDQADAVAVRLQARGRQYEAALVDARSVEQAVALTVSFVTTVVAESLMTPSLETDPATAAASDAGDGSTDTDAAPARRSGSVRSAIAIPYFSFARGTGRAGRS